MSLTLFAFEGGKFHFQVILNDFFIVKTNYKK